MLFRRTLALLVSLTLPLAACDAPAKDARPAPSPSRTAYDPKATIAASLSGVDAGIYSFVVTTTSGAVDGILHAPSRSLETTSRQEVGTLTVTTRTLLIGDQQYLNMTGSGAGWQELLDGIAKHRGKKLPKDVRETYEMLSGETWTSVPKKPGNPDLTGPDALGVKALLSHVETVRATSPNGNNRIAGTIDASRLSRSPDLLGSMAKLTVPAKDLAAKPIPYALYITSGRLSMIDLTMPGEAGHWLITLADYGKARPAPAPPAEKIKKLPPADLEPLLEGDPVHT